MMSALTPGLFSEATETQVCHVATHCSLSEHEEPRWPWVLSWFFHQSISFRFTCLTPLLWRTLPPSQDQPCLEGSHLLRLWEISQCPPCLTLSALPKWDLWHSPLANIALPPFCQSQTHQEVGLSNEFYTLGPGFCRCGMPPSMWQVNHHLLSASSC